MSSGKTLSRGEDPSPSPLDIIFACSVCGDTVSDVYKGHTESMQGLSDGINTKDRIVSRLFVSACCHVICIKHIEGGNGPPFHPSGQHPRAPCPVCTQEGTEKGPRELYAIRGFKPGEYDPAIPKFWFASPPMKLQGNGAEMEALRFHYLSLVRFGKKTSIALQHAKDELAEKQRELDTMRNIANSEHAKVVPLEQELEHIRPLEQELYRFKARLPAIHHYLGVVPLLVEQRERMQARLKQLGHAMELEPIPPFPDELPFEQNATPENLNANAEQQIPASSHTVGRSAQNTGYAEELGDRSSPQTGRPSKRARINSPPRTNNPNAPSSRDLMPPPSKTLSRMKSVRKFIPSIRQRFSRSKPARLSPAMQELSSDVQMYENGYCEAVDPPDQLSSERERPPARHGTDAQNGGPYMSGALPVEPLPQAEAVVERQPLPNAGMQSGDFTFRSLSPIKLDQPQAQTLPVEPSYIRLMDGLGKDCGLNLGLHDPRLGPSQAYGSTPAAVTRDNNNAGGQGVTYHQSMRASSPQVPRHVEAQDAYPTGHYHAMTHNQAIEPVTPAPSRFRPAPGIENVVSPFFGSHVYDSARIPRTSMTERQNSTPRSNAYRFREPKFGENWSTGRSLNGLSFFDSPLNDRNEPIEPGYRGRRLDSVAPQRYQSRNVDARGFIVRPGGEPSARASEGIYGSVGRSSVQQPPLYPPGGPVSFRAFSRASRSRPALASSATGSLEREYRGSPIRASRQWSGLERAGVRSSRASHGSFGGNTSATPVRTLFSRSGRRSVRR